MIVKSIWLRRIHKWVGLVIGLQLLIWAISGTAMALLPMDEVAGGGADARSKADAPEIDGTVFLRDVKNLKPGDIVNVKIEDAEEYDLYGVQV